MSSDSTWTAKQDRQYKHIVEAEQQRGRTEKQAREIAMSVVTKTPKPEGKAPKAS